MAVIIATEDNLAESFDAVNPTSNVVLAVPSDNTSTPPPASTGTRSHGHA